MGLVLDWSNLDPLLRPFLIALTASAFLAIPLRVAAERSGLPRARERCVGCRAEPALISNGYCPERCTVNAPGPVGLATFVCTTCVALWTFLDPSDVRRYVLPLGDGAGTAGTALLALIVATAAGASLLVAAYFVQDLIDGREGLLRGSAAASLGLIVLGTTASAALVRWVGLLLPVTLTALILGVAVDGRARRGRPTFGLRTLGVATAPMFLVAALGVIRAGQMLALAGA